MTYKERLLASDEELRAADVDNQVELASTKLQARIAQEKSTLAAIRAQRDRIVGGSAFNADAVVENTRMLKSQQEVVDELESVFNELFPSE